MALQYPLGWFVTTPCLLFDRARMDVKYTVCISLSLSIHIYPVSLVPKSARLRRTHDWRSSNIPSKRICSAWVWSWNHSSATAKHYLPKPRAPSCHAYLTESCDRYNDHDVIWLIWCDHLFTRLRYESVWTKNWCQNRELCGSPDLSPKIWSHHCLHNLYILDQSRSHWLELIHIA